MTSKRPFSPEEFRAIYSKVPRLCTDLVIKTPQGIVLSLRNLPSWRGRWHLPGGTVLYKEKVVDAIKRVAWEELSISVRPQKLLGYIEFPSEEKERGFGHTVSMVFLCFTDNVDFKPNEESSKIELFKELPSDLIKEQRIFLESVWHDLNK